MVVMVVVVVSHAGEFPAESTEAAGDGLPLGSLGWCDVAAIWWESVHPLVDVCGEHHFARRVRPVMDRVGELW